MNYFAIAYRILGKPEQVGQRYFAATTDTADFVRVKRAEGLKVAVTHVASIDKDLYSRITAETVKAEDCFDAYGIEYYFDHLGPGQRTRDVFMVPKTDVDGAEYVSSLQARSGSAITIQKVEPISIQDYVLCLTGQVNVLDRLSKGS